MAQASTRFAASSDQTLRTGGVCAGTRVTLTRLIHTSAPYARPPDRVTSSRLRTTHHYLHAHITVHAGNITTKLRVAQHGGIKCRSGGQCSHNCGNSPYLFKQVLIDFRLTLHLTTQDIRVAHHSGPTYLPQCVAMAHMIAKRFASWEDTHSLIDRETGKKLMEPVRGTVRRFQQCHAAVQAGKRRQQLQAEPHSAALPAGLTGGASRTMQPPACIPGAAAPPPLLLP